MKKSVSVWAASSLAALVIVVVYSQPAQAAEDAEKSEKRPKRQKDDAKNGDEGAAPAPPSPGPELNPFECYGRYQAAAENRTMAEMGHELKQRLEWLNEPGQADTERAIKLCVIGKLKARLGESDAYDYFLKSIEADPVEPGLELWTAQYWSGNRGARRPVVERAEKHYYAALAKLEALKRAGRLRDYHAIVEDWVHHDLVVLYQMDGVPVLPWKAYPQHSSGLNAPGVSLSSQVRGAKDTRDFFFNNEYRQFTGEKAFANSPIRSGGALPPLGYGPLDKTQTWELVRAPYRLQFDNKVRIRQNAIGTIDLLHTYLRQWGSQVYNFYDPTRSCTATRMCDATLPEFSDIQVQQVGVGYERVFPLYPLMDLRLAGTVQRVWRDGIVEFHPWNVNHDGVSNVRESLNLYEFKPSISRFLGADKLTINGVLAVLDLPTQPTPIDDRLRRKVIEAVTFEYGDYHTLILPTFDYGGLSTYRTPTRGLYFFGGVMQDGEAWGSHRVIGRDYYLGTRLEGPHWTDFTIQGTYETTANEYYDISGHGPTVIYTSPGQDFSSFRTTFVLQYRVRSADTFPGMPPSHGGFGSDMFHLVFPFFWDKQLTGGNDFENVRGGAQIWTKLIGEGIGGTTFLVTAGVDYQYFYRIEKGLVMGQVALRMGWGDL